MKSFLGSINLVNFTAGFCNETLWGTVAAAAFAVAAGPRLGSGVLLQFLAGVRELLGIYDSSHDASRHHVLHCT